MSDYVKDTREHQDGWREGHASRDAEVAELRAEHAAHMESMRREVESADNARDTARRELDELWVRVRRWSQEREKFCAREGCHHCAPCDVADINLEEYIERAEVERLVRERDEAREAFVQAFDDRDAARRELDAVRERVRDYCVRGGGLESPSPDAFAAACSGVLRALDGGT